MHFMPQHHKSCFFKRSKNCPSCWRVKTREKCRSVPGLFIKLYFFLLWPKSGCHYWRGCNYHCGQRIVRGALYQDVPRVYCVTRTGSQDTVGLSCSDSECSENHRRTEVRDINSHSSSDFLLSTSETKELTQMKQPRSKRVTAGIKDLWVACGCWVHGQVCQLWLMDMGAMYVKSRLKYLLLQFPKEKLKWFMSFLSFALQLT